MNHRIVFGATGLEVSPICFGTWQLSPQITEAIGAMGKTISREDYFTVRKALAVNGVSKIQDATGQRK